MNSIRADLKSKSPSELKKICLELLRACPPEDATLERVNVIGELLVKKGEPLLAFELLNQLPEKSRNHVRVRQSLGLALARTGAAVEAQKILEPLCQDLLSKTGAKSQDEKVELEEALSMLGRTYKDLGLPLKPGDPIRSRADLETACKCYTLAYQSQRGYYPGINVAFLCQLLGDTDSARVHARQAYDECQQLLSQPEQAGFYWIHATIGEAAVHLGLEAEAKSAYAEAGRLCRKDNDYGSLSTTLRQLRFLLASLGRSPDESNVYLKIPRVAVFAGHMADQPNRPFPRFPESLKDQVQKQIADWLEREDVEIGFSSAACGSDLLFIDAILNRNGRSHVFLPFSADDFKASSIGITGSPVWTALFEKNIGKVLVKEVSQRKLSFGEVAYGYSNQLLHGAAIVEADRLGTELKRLAVWDGEVGDGPGGTSDVVSQWLNLTTDVDVIRVPQVAPAVSFTSLGKPIPQMRPIAYRSESTDLRTMVAALLFADVKGFSGLNETQIPVFVKEFLGAVANLLDSRYSGTEKRNTWGDGLYVAFDSVKDAGMFALDLAQLMLDTDWTRYGLPKELSIRTALHAGPVYLCQDPLTNRPNCIGTNVSHTARLEPSTPVNQVYASFEFAAMTAMLGITEFSCHYVGHKDWAKNYGVYPTYHVRR